MADAVVSEAMRTIRTAENREAFLEALRASGNVTAACEAAGIARTAAYEWRNEEDEFRNAWEAALELGTDALEDEAVRRASEGTVRPVFYKGSECGGIREYSDTLLIFMLKARRPDRFKERSASEITGANGAPLVPVLNVSIAGDQPRAAPDAGARAPHAGD